MRILVTGADGQLGVDVVRVASERGHEVLGANRGVIDITYASSTQQVIGDWNPDAVIHCAGYTMVDDAESDIDGAMLVNGEGTRNVSEACNATNAHLIAVSTDYVFPGTNPEGYAEQDRVEPVNAYGASKLAGEEAARQATRWTIARTSWVFGGTGNNFVRTIAGLCKDRESIAVVDDQSGNPTYTGHLARALVECAEKDVQGVLHLSGSPNATWHDLAVEVAKNLGSHCRVDRTTSDAYPRPAKRPACSILRVTRADTPVVGDWREGVRLALSELQAASGSASSS